MKSIHLLFCLFATTPLMFSGCSGTGGVAWGEEAGGGASPMAAAGAANGETVRTGSISTTLINATVTIIAQHEATMKQRQIAEERGRAWVTAEHKRTAAVRKAEIQTKAPQPVRHKRYIAVDTESDSRTAPQAQKSVMIFDTQAEQVVGKDVYDVQSPPPVGGIARFETYSAEYVGTGL